MVISTGCVGWGCHGGEVGYISQGFKVQCQEGQNTVKYWRRVGGGGGGGVDMSSRYRHVWWKDI